MREFCEVGIGLSSSSLDDVCDKWKISWVLGFFFFSNWGDSGNEKFNLGYAYFDLVL